MSAELHPYFEPDVLAELNRLRDLYQVEQVLDAMQPCRVEQNPVVQSLDRLAWMFQEQRNGLGRIAHTLERVLEIIGGPVDTMNADGTGDVPVYEDRNMYRETCTVKEACALVHVCRRTLYNWMQKGKVQVVRTAGGGPRIVRASLFYEGARR